MPYWTQIASKFKVKFQFRVGQICHSPEKFELRFIGQFFTIFKIIFGKPTKFPFDRCMTNLCVIHTTLNIIYNWSVKIFSPHPVNENFQFSSDGYLLYSTGNFEQIIRFSLKVSAIQRISNL